MKCVRAEFVNNPDNYESILQITHKVEKSSMPILKPYSELELAWSD